MRRIGVRSWVLLIAIMFLAESTVHGQKPPDATKEPPQSTPAKPDAAKAGTNASEQTALKMVRVFGALTGRSSGAFDQKLATEGNKPIGPRWSVGAEGDLVAVPLALIGGSVKVPLGCEYINAVSRTVHQTPESTTTVTWNLPTFGCFVGPAVAFGEASDEPGQQSKRWVLYLHPAIGVYRVGDWFASDDLSITDRSGRLNLKGTAPGFFVTAGARVPVSKKASFFAEVGYRHLRFTDVRVMPEGDFTETAGGALVRAGSLNVPLDYSGLMLRFGVATSF